MREHEKKCHFDLPLLYHITFDWTIFEQSKLRKYHYHVNNILLDTWSTIIEMKLASSSSLFGQ